MKHAEAKLKELQVVDLQGKYIIEEQLKLIAKTPTGNFILRHRTCLTICPRIKTRLKGPTIGGNGKPETVMV